MLVEPVQETQALEMSEFQQQVLAVPEKFDLFLGGGRGGGKSYGLALLALVHAEQYREKARILYLRQSFPGVADFVALTRELFGTIYGAAASYNAASHVWTLPSGAYFEINQLETPADYQKYQGRSFSLLLIDEAGQWPDPQLLDMLRSNLRGPEGVPVRVAMAANPGGVGHHWLALRYVFKASPWVPFLEDTSTRRFVYCPSLYSDNKFIDQESYRRQVEAGTATDPELGRAWLEGDWAIARGAYFGPVLEESRNCVDPWPIPEQNPDYWRFARRAHYEPQRGGHSFYGGAPRVRNRWDLSLAYDHGSAKPAVCFVSAEARDDLEGPDGRHYRKGSIVLIDELATNEPGTLNTGMQYTVPSIAEEIKEMCTRWDIRPSGVADDSIFAKHGSGSGSIGDEFKRCGVYFRPARKKDRVASWETMRRMLADAGSVDSPGLYIARNCEYFWATVPYLERDPRRVEDVDTRGPDHAADAARYGCIAWWRQWSSQKFRLA